MPGTGYVLACAAVGVPEGGEPYAWTVLLQPPGEATATGLLIGLAGLLIALAALRRPPLSGP